MKAREIKRRADSVLEEIFRSLFEEIDMDKVRKEVAAMREGAPELQRIEHSRQLARRAAIGSLGADLAYLMFQQFRLIVAIATIYGHEPTHRERFAEAMSCLAYASGVGLGKHGIGTLLESATVEGGMVAEKIGTRFMRERLTKVIPFVGALSGGALNYWSVRAVGRAAIKYYEGLVEESVADEIWAEGDREHA